MFSLNIFILELSLHLWDFHYVKEQLTVKMNLAAEFATLARRGLNLLDYTHQFCHLAIHSPYDNETIQSLYWIRVNYNHQVDLLDMQGLSWKDVILICLERVYPSSIPQPDPEPNPPSPCTVEISPEPPPQTESIRPA